MEDAINNLDDSDIFKKIDNWWIRGSFRKFEWEYWLLVIQKLKYDMWLINLDSDEDGFRPKDIFNTISYCPINNLEVGDLIHISLYNKPHYKVYKKEFTKEELTLFDDWFYERMYEKVKDNPMLRRNLNKNTKKKKN